jgi:hypothetical protein
MAADRRHLADEDIAALIIDHLVRELRRTHTLRLI